MWALKLLLVLVAIYRAVALIALAARTWMLCPTGLAGGRTALPGSAEPFAHDTPDGERLRGVRLPPCAKRR